MFTSARLWLSSLDEDDLWWGFMAVMCELLYFAAADFR